MSVVVQTLRGLPYVESTWTPVLTFVTPGDLSVAYTTQEGRYTKIGRMVSLDFNLVLSTFTFTTASGNLTITGVPFAPTAVQAVGTLGWAGITKVGYTDVFLQISAGATLINAVASGSAVALSFVVAADMPSAGAVRLRGAIAYSV